jgi:predicted MFS family arabinose efflux permease
VIAPAQLRLGLGPFVSAVFLAESAFYAVVPPLLPRLAADAQMTTAEIGVLVAAYPAGVMIAAIPAIALVGRAGVRFATAVGMALLILATVAFAWSSEPVLLDAARFVQGVGGAVAWAGALAWLISRAPSTRRATVIGGAVGAALIGMVIGPIIGAAATWIGRGAVFTGIAVVLAVMAALTPASAPSVPSRRNPIKALVHLFSVPQAAIGNVLVAVIGVINGTLASLAPLLVAKRGGPAAAIAAIFVASYVLASFWNIVTGRIADRIGRLIPLVFGFGVAAIALPFLPSIGALIPLGVAIVIAGSSASGLWSPTAAMVADGADPGPADQAVAVAVTNAAWAAGGTIGAIAASRIADASGFEPPFLLVGALCAAASLACFAIWRGGHLQPALERAPRRQE